MAGVNCKKVKKCRICGNIGLKKILDLGKMPPANAFVSPNSPKKERNYPLVLKFCNNCKLAQLGHVVNPKILFSNYHYLTGASKPLAEHFEKEARMIDGKYISSPQDLVVEFGSNDGILLGALKNKCRTLGVDPAENVAEIASQKGIKTITDFFGQKSASMIKRGYGPAKIIVANNVFAHIDDLNDAMKGVDVLLSADGLFISESHWVGNLIGNGGFDQIYHEHLSYYSLHAIKYLAEKHGLNIADIEIIPIHGASLRIYMSRSDKKSRKVLELLKKEKLMGLTKIDKFSKFSKKVERNKKNILRLIRSIKKSGKRIAGYGAPAKGNTLLNYLGLSAKEIDFIVDTTPLKQGTLAPGSGIPVVHPDILKTNPPEYIILLSWNYADKILAKEKQLRQSGVKFIIPVPLVKII